MYSRNKAEKLKKEFGYLKGKSYFPYGKEGKECKIEDLNLSVKKVNTMTPEFHAYGEGNPNYEKEENERLALDNNWNVNVIISDGEEEIINDLEDVLSKLHIRHNINKIND